MSAPEHKRYLDMAARGALRAAGDVEPNPLVGAVVVRKGEVIGAGHHRRFGGLHAEREALARCRALGHDPRGATVYCTLEPCRHVGKQPPCTEALIEAGAARVVYARPDPAEVSGGGCAVLRAAGVEAELCTESALAIGVSDPFVHRVRTGRPWVIVKWAQTVDGKLDTRDEGRRWVSGEAARRRVHRVRARVDAIVTGIGTVVADDPLLTARGVARVRREAMRVVLDSRGRMPDGAAMLNDGGPEVRVISEGTRDVVGVLRSLQDDDGVSSVLIEAGPRVIGSVFEAGCADDVIVHVPTRDGDAAVRAVMAFAPDLTDRSRYRDPVVRRVGADAEVLVRRVVGL